MQDFAFHHPGEGLQADVRVCSHMQALSRAELHGTRMVQKAPGTDHATVGVGQCAANGRVFPGSGHARDQALEMGN
ncbi:hypothetical protein D3C78_1924430 [compost metagenome]